MLRAALTLRLELVRFVSFRCSLSLMLAPGKNIEYSFSACYHGNLSVLDPPEFD